MAAGPKTAVIVGSAMEDLFPVRGNRTVRVGSAEVKVYRSASGKIPFFLLPRHLRDHSIPPHKIDHVANLKALKQLGVQNVVATSAVGSISGKLKVGSLGVLEQFIDLSTRHVTIFEDAPVHVDMTHPYDPELQKALAESARSLSMNLVSDLVYVCVDGPRYETAAEIKMFSIIGGDVVGMTGAPEAIVARELGMRYASVVVATNRAAGLQERVSHEEVVSAMSRAKPKVRKLVLGALAQNNRF